MYANHIMSTLKPVDAAIATLVALLLIQASVVGITAGVSDDETVYLEQARPIVADARTNLTSLQFYIPLGSSKDPDDPTWASAEQSSEALQEDADALTLLSPPDRLASTNSSLIADLTRGAKSAEEAIDALSAGNTTAGAAALATFNSTVQDLNGLANTLSGDG
jgi:hypothetical protein